MAKINRTYPMDTDSIKKLEWLAERGERSQAATLRKLIKDEYERESP